MMRKFLVWTALLTTVLVWHPACARAAGLLEMKVRPNHIPMNATYNGLKLSVTGRIPVNAEALIRFVGKIQTHQLKKKGKALGVLWMNLGAVTFRGVPTVFILCPSDVIGNWMRKETDEWRHVALGFGALENQTDIVPPSENKNTLFQEFVKLKQHGGLYEVQKNAVKYKQVGGSVKTFSCTVSLPSDLPQGRYRVQVFALRGGRVISHGEETIEAAATGLPAALSSLAFHHGTLYGVLAVLVALLAGALTGFIFKGGKGAH